MANVCSFLWLSSIPVCVCVCVCVWNMYCSFFIHSSLDGHKLFPCLGNYKYSCYEHGVGGMYLFKLVHLVLAIYPGVELLGYMAVLVSVFRGALHAVFHSSCTNFVVGIYWKEKPKRVV